MSVRAGSPALTQISQPIAPSGPALEFVVVSSARLMVCRRRWLVFALAMGLVVRTSVAVLLSPARALVPVAGRGEANLWLFAAPRTSDGRIFSQKPHKTLCVFALVVLLFTLRSRRGVIALLAHGHTFFIYRPKISLLFFLFQNAAAHEQKVSHVT